MGASAWHAHVPYQDDLDAALRQARWNAYHARAFYRVAPNETALSMTEDEFVAWSVESQREALLEAFGPDDWEPDDSDARTEWRAAHVVVDGPDSLLEAQPYAGTHSVIDMTDVAAEPEFGAVAPVPDELLDQVFGTRRPTPAAVRQAVAEHAVNGFGRWYGAYIIAYEEATPAEISFFGWSGD
ncbi:hypothetical protein [Catellatospora tritici]|uniref:hypothetical protein n=1 Tax=Catellatospora tritici TaxID=2851566 RepID=UPI001C2D5A34|nr:hypothetical protein [Catellatospora tritici]MBV1850731.1 hypothetical protein [Catellatospora tritici]MBV1850984.1 hypothetical protein [Catellatospora tritici]